ncbi:hypothetical protein [Mesorhizobium captivum]|uniref:hypothetical protein n=1 Tax=Mesorhizobium captivum TaxID=3072319 RepID=UPI002A23BF2B|nr:hypothetical protein [Mesorhizobium sp. VK23E]MDX8515413.1 hypothetical protein [Mesorhizobium sp. VK23E]
MVFAFRYARKGLLQAAAFASQRFIKRGRPFVVGRTGSRQSRTWAPPLSSIFPGCNRRFSPFFALLDELVRRLTNCSSFDELFSA